MDETNLHQAARTLAERLRPCTCTHADEHTIEDGCLHGWGVPPYTEPGCMCNGVAARAYLREETR